MDMANIDIVRANWRDAWELSRLERRCFSRADMLGWLQHLGLCLWPGVVALKAVAAGGIVGFVVGDPRRWRGHVIIVTLGVDPGWRR
ncbi:MAG TPA: N-acetyltransferase, partial [Anaerolineae bacterium]|nr:N-acetyltransferase [Anaerolineae bacterium]